MRRCRGIGRKRLKSQTEQIMSRQLIRLLLSLQVFWLVGCATTAYGKISAKQMADRLEKFRIGTPFSRIAEEFPELVAGRTNGELKKVELLVHAFVRIDPCHEGYSHLTMYRQYPAGMLLELVQDDYVLSPDVADNAIQAGRMLVFFDAEKNYKGYLAHSTARHSMDQDRLKFEKTNFIKLGLVEEAERARRADDLVKAGGDWKSKLPKLPLKNNRAVSQK